MVHTIPSMKVLLSFYVFVVKHGCHFLSDFVGQLLQYCWCSELLELVYHYTMKNNHLILFIFLKNWPPLL